MTFLSRHSLSGCRLTIHIIQDDSVDHRSHIFPGLNCLTNTECARNFISPFTVWLHALPRRSNHICRPLRFLHCCPHLPVILVQKVVVATYRMYRRRSRSAWMEWKAVVKLLGDGFAAFRNSNMCYDRPTPLVAANFIILGTIIRRLGPVYSRLSPRSYAVVFTLFDLVALIIQGVGGGTAAVAIQENRSPEKGGHIMLAGIAFQMITITIYVSCAAEFFLRYITDRPVRSVAQPITGSEDVTRGTLTQGIKVMIQALLLSTVCLFIRAVYRTIELADGWTGRIITTEVYFNVLDGAMIVIAIYTLSIAHPGLLLPLKKIEHLEQTEKSSESLTDTA